MGLMELTATLERQRLRPEESRSSERGEAPAVDLDADFEVHDACRPDGVVFEHRRRPLLVKEFSRIEGVARTDNRTCCPGWMT